MTDWDKVARQTQGYRELDEFKPGDSLHLQYFPVPEEELARHQKEKDKLAMQKYEEQLKEKEETKKALLELREEATRENGHTVKVEIPINYNGKEIQRIIKKETITDICKDCDKHTILCTCNNKQQNPSRCDLKKTKRKSKKK